MNTHEHIMIISRRENRLDQAYWMEVELIDELHREATPQHEMELHYARAERLYELVERCVIRKVAISNRHVCVCDGGGFRDPCQWSGNQAWGAPTGSRINPDPTHFGDCQYGYVDICTCPF